MQTYTVSHVTNTSREPNWIDVWHKQIQADYPEDIIDRYEYPGTPRMTTYSDGTVECTWEHFDENEYVTVRNGLIVSVATPDLEPDTCPHGIPSDGEHFCPDCDTQPVMIWDATLNDLAPISGGSHEEDTSYLDDLNTTRTANEARWLRDGLNAQETADYLDFIRDYIKAGDWRSAGQARQEILTKTSDRTLADEIYDTAKQEAR